MTSTFSSAEINFEEGAAWYCIWCWEKQKKGRLTSWDRSPTIEKFFRLEQIMPENLSNSSINRKLSSLKNQIYDAIENSELVDSILNSYPRPFPTTFPMDKGSRQDHARLGRLFEIELLCIRVYACACCGRTKPYADGPNSKSRVTTNFHRQNLADKYYPAFFVAVIFVRDSFSALIEANI